MSPSLTWSAELRELPLRYTWKIARNASESKTNCFVKVTDGTLTGLGEAAPNVRYGESPEEALAQFGRVKDQLPHVSDADPIALEDQLRTLPVMAALRFGLHAAYVDYYCRKHGTTVANLYAIPEAGAVNTLFSLPIMPAEALKAFIETHQLMRFQALKVKVSREGAAQSLREVYTLTRKPLLIDGNEAWTDPEELLLTLKEVQDLPVLALEQPMPAHLQAEYRYLKPLSPFRLLADESVTDQPDLPPIQDQFHGINVKLMKAGGYGTGIRQLQQARQQGLDTMVGCMIESTLGISAALQLTAGVSFVDLDGFLHLQQDPFGKVTEEQGRLQMKR